LKYLFYLNGGHEELACLEVLSLLNAYEIQYKTVFKGRQAIIIDSEHIAQSVLSRLALTHRAMAFLGNVSPEFGEVPCNRLEGLCGSFSVRIKKIDKGINSMLEEKRISEQIISRTSLNVDLTNPDHEIYGLYLDDNIYLGHALFVNDPKSFQSRKPQYRPYFHPSSIDPRLARAIVNLSEAKEEVMDPFCGTGGILIEAGLMGLEVHGIDIEKKMVEGTRSNLGHYGVEGDIRLGDSSRMPTDRHFETVVTDVPYGRSTVIGKDRDVLYKVAFEKIYEICKKKAVVVTPAEHDFTQYGFRTEAKAAVRVHKSLIRHIYKLGKS